jgi:hypothetical protein
MIFVSHILPVIKIPESSRFVKAAIIQIDSDPERFVMAALGGIVFLGELLILRLALSSVAILGGIALVILVKQHANGTQ